MTFLPVLARELRARAISPAAYWGRVGVVLTGLLVGLPGLIWAGPVAAPGLAGRAAFNALIGVAFGLCCVSCCLTSDVLSRERREGTLVLLLLTRVSRWDVLAGKLGSSGLAALTGLLALVPVLAIPLLMGGTSPGEAARNATALINTMFLALAAGLCASSAGYDRFRTSSTALLIVGGVVLAPMLLGPHLRLASPLGTVLQSTDQAYGATPARFWISVGLVHGLAWVLLYGAAIGLRKRAGEPNGMLGKAFRYSRRSVTVRGVTASVPSEVECSYCGRRNAGDTVHCHECGSELFPTPKPLTNWTVATAPSPLHWLLRRQRGMEPMLWAAAIIVASQTLLAGFGLRLLRLNAPFQFLSFYSILSLVVLTVSGMIIAAAASRFVMDARRDRTLELLLTTPLGASGLVTAQWDMVKRMMVLPLLLMLAPSLLRATLMIRGVFAYGDLWMGGYMLSLVLNIASTIIGIAALCWLALWFAFGGMGKGRTLFWSVLLVHLLPALPFYFWSMFLSAVMSRLPSQSQLISLVLHSLLPQVIGILYHLFLIRLARSGLRSPLLGGETFSLRPPLREALGQILAAVRRARRWPETA